MPSETELLKPSFPEVTATEDGLHSFRAEAALLPSAAARQHRPRPGLWLRLRTHQLLRTSRPRKAWLSEGDCVRSEPELGRTASWPGRSHLLTLSCPTRCRKRNSPAPQPDEAEAMLEYTRAGWCHPQAPPRSPSAPPCPPSAPPHPLAPAPPPPLMNHLLCTKDLCSDFVRSLLK